MTRRPHNKILPPVGAVFGRLTVLGGTDSPTKWRVKCECGAEKDVVHQVIRLGKARSCGCIRREMMTKHGYSVGPTARAYKLWIAMNQRCRESPAYANRGISVCDEWQDFEAFHRDMGDPPEGMSLDRIDNDRGYSKENCRWATRAQQGRNRTDNRYLTAWGETKTITDWAAHFGVHYATIYTRLKSGWSLERALSEPAHKGKNQFLR
jgi:hypothetical protein